MSSKYSQRFERYGDYHVTYFFFFFFLFASTRLFITIFKKSGISLVRSRQYVSARQKSSKYSKRFKSDSDFHKLITDGCTNMPIFFIWLDLKLITDEYGNYRTLLVSPPFG